MYIATQSPSDGPAAGDGNTREPASAVDLDRVGIIDDINRHLKRAYPAEPLLNHETLSSDDELLDILSELKAKPDAKLGKAVEPDGTKALLDGGICNYLRDELKRDLPMGEKFLYIVLLGRCGNFKNHCIVSNGTLGKELSVTKRSIQIYLYGDNRSAKSIGLVARGLVEVEPHHHYDMNKYTLPEWRKINFRKVKTIATARKSER